MKNYREMSLNERAEYMGISDKLWGEYEGKNFSIWVKLNGEQPSDFYLIRHMDLRWMKWLGFYKPQFRMFNGFYDKDLKFSKSEMKSHYDLMLMYENEPLKNRRYQFQSYADYFGHSIVMADPSYWW